MAPSQVTHQGPTDIHETFEEITEPHAHADEALNKDDDADEAVLSRDDVKTLDRQIRITLTDPNRFGLSDNCHKCTDLRAGAFQTGRHHFNKCRLRMYLEYRQVSNAQWRAVKHLVEPEPDAKFDHKHIDPEGLTARDFPRAQDGTA